MSNVVVNVEVQSKAYPAGTADPGFTYTLGARESVVSVDTSVTFENVEAGDYTLTVEKLGVAVTITVTVAAETVTISVPFSVSASVV